MNLFSSGEKEGIRGNDQCLYPILGEVSETCVKVTLGRGFNHNHCLSQFLCRVLSIRYGGLTVWVVWVHQETNDRGGWAPVFSQYHTPFFFCSRPRTRVRSRLPHAGGALQQDQTELDQTRPRR